MGILDAPQRPVRSVTPSWAALTDFKSRPASPLVATHGDSITANGSGVTTWTGSSFSRTSSYQSLGYQTCAMVWNRQPATWVNTGIGGTTAAQGLARYDTDVAPLKPAVLIEAHGTNDTVSNRPAADTFADKQAMWRKAWASGASVIATNCPPRNTFTTAQAQEAQKLNALMRNFARTNPDRFMLVDWYSVLADPLTGLYKTAYTTDGVHPNSAGAWAAGKAFEAALDRFLPSTVSGLAAGVNDVDNLNTYGLMPSTGGVILSNKGVTGQIATGLTGTSNGTDATVTAALSKVARSDGFGEWQQVTTTVVPNTSAYVEIQFPVQGSWAVGNVIQSYVEFETDAAGWTNGVLDLLLILFDGSGNGVHLASAFSSAAEPGTDKIVLTRPEQGVLQTPPIIIPTGTTTVLGSMRVGGLGITRFGRLATRLLPVAA